jgi:hypothetical protein
VPRVAIIGSFNRHYDAVLEAVDAFARAGIEVTSPRGTDRVPGAAMRFEGDDPALSEAQLEELALERILAADAVYVLAPGGYVGRATAYEIGRLTQAGRALWFSEPPADLPVAARVATLQELIARLRP